MRLVLRLFGTWLLALAAILFVVDLGQSLSAGAAVTTALGESWSRIHPESLAVAKDFITSRFFGAALLPVLNAILAAPGWVVVGVPAVLFALAGRTRRARVFVRHDQI